LPVSSYTPGLLASPLHFWIPEFVTFLAGKELIMQEALFSTAIDGERCAERLGGVPKKQIVSEFLF
jgi:hypothetical protein